MLRTFWQKIFKYNYVFGLVLILLVGIPRFFIVIQANVTGNYNLVPVVFLFMWFSPLIFLTKNGRRSIGIKRPSNYYWLFYSFVLGILICMVTYIVAIFLFEHTISNWFVYISKSYTVSGMIVNDSNRLIYFLIYSLTGITISPIGEELFYRGLVHGSFVTRFGEQKASIADSSAFALTHLAHFGIVYYSGTWHFLFIPALLWVLFMFITSRIFFVCKQKTGSLLGAIFGHAAFNLTMMYLIFYYIL